MKFFIDECLDPELFQVAIGANYQATCSRDQGLLSLKDWDLAHFVVTNDWTLVTLNSKDFRGKKPAPGGKPGYLTKAMHPGLSCLNLLESKAAMSSAMQKELFHEAIDEIQQRGIMDLMNLVLEIDYDESTGYVTANIWEAPSC
jgi:predicted nuclease of predicted toxin-antitoxin system